jgi:hypothetical protein
MDNVQQGTRAYQIFFYTTKDSSIRVEPTFFDELFIQQRFHSDYMNNMFLQVQIPVADAILLLEHYQDLKVQIKSFPIEPITGQYIVNTFPTVKTYKVIIPDAEDLFKKYSRNELIPDPGSALLESQHGMIANLNVQLFEEDAYYLRNTSISGILRNATIKDAIYYVCNILGIKDTEITPPDNNRRYVNLEIPAVKQLANIFDYLQDTYGIYKDGLNYYFTEGKLYVYPGYRTNPTTQSVVHIYNVPMNSYLGLKGYHYKEKDGTVHILCNQEVQVKNMAPEGVERNGSHRVFFRTDRFFDTSRVANSRTHQIQQNYAGISLAHKRGAVAKSSRLEYGGVTNNIYAVSSALAEFDCTLLTSSWLKAEYGILQPGQKVIYHYDQDRVYTTTQGVVVEVTYVTSISDRKSDYQYTTVAVYGLRLESNPME